MYQRSRKRRSRIRAVTDISLTPLIDTALTLLIIFMVTSQVTQRSIRVQLPKGETQEAKQRATELVLYLDKHGAMTFEQVTFKRGALDGLKKLLEKKLTGRDTIFVHADTACAYGEVVELVTKLKDINGLQHVVFAMEPVNKKSSIIR